MLFPFYFIGVWVLVGFIISRMGWHSFAQKYASATRPPGRSFNCRSAWFGSIFASYRNVLRVVFTAEGIYIYPMVLFRAFHPPFLVPWDKVVGVASRRQWFFGTRHELEVQDGSDEIHIILSDAAHTEWQKIRNL